ncbi:MAG: Trk system potassium transporter TrkA [Candidatus Omnitrophota bacterium]|jgi:trk system potassium uptake protein TrkA|nr:MAG: Trk system potassium transporter TrkA [Candidatus Omnitrophota bacterium]
MVIIIGAGEVGKGLARRLTAEGHQVKIIDNNPVILADIESKLDVLTVAGNGASASVLLQAGIENADLFIGVSDNDACNLLSCAIVKQFNVMRTIARVRSEDYLLPDRSHYSNAMNIDLIINPDEVAAIELYDLLENPIANSVADFAGGRLKLVGFRATIASPICNRTLQELPELGFSDSLLIGSLVRGNEVIIPRGDTRVIPGDQVYVIVDSASLDKLNKLGGIAARELRKVVIVGASRVSFFLAEKLKNSGANLILIDQDEARCEQFAAELEHATILHGDGTDITMLNEAGVNEADGFVAASQDDETNILSALLAKEQGAKRVISLLRKPQYIPLLAHIKPIDVAVNPRLATINAIMRYVRQGKILTMATLAEDKAEAIEVVVDSESVLIGKKLKDGFIPRDILLGAIVRENEVIIPKGEDELRANDQAIVIALKDKISKVDELFSRKKPPFGLKQFFGSL